MYAFHANTKKDKIINQMLLEKNLGKLVCFSQKIGIFRKIFHKNGNNRKFRKTTTYGNPV